MPIRSLVASALFAVVASLGCNFIMNPDGDGIFRCDNPDDCDVPLQAELADDRGQSRCAAAGGGGGGFTQSQDNKVCSLVDREDVSCNPSAIMSDPEIPVAKAYAEAQKQNGAYASCIIEDYGTAGCPPNGSTCNTGLEVRTYQSLSGDADNPEQMEFKVCAPKGVDVVAPNTATRQFDVLDQHCRSFFCDESFVCNRGSGTSSGWRCVRCDPEKAYGNGGCGTMYLQGAPSTVYTDDLGGDACESTANFDKTDFGPVVQAPAPPNP